MFCNQPKILQREPDRTMSDDDPCSLRLPVDNLLIFCQNLLPPPDAKGPELDTLSNLPEPVNISDTETESPLSVSGSES